MSEPPRYGEGPASYNAAGQQEGLRKLVDSFYDYMDTLPEAADIRAMHPKDLTVSRDKLALFLCGWTGGPKLFPQKYPTTPIPVFHSQFKIGVPERDAWLLCMRKALADQPYAEDFRQYMIEQLFVPAERSRVASEERRKGSLE
ncbi:MAG: group II truncated hemoglobin [Pseudomonadota bacterium]